MKLADINLEHLLPLFMRRDAANCAAADVASKALRVFAHALTRLSTWDALHALSVPELDALADELRVIWYDPGLDVQAKRALLANSDKVYMRLGTVQAIKDVIRDIYGESHIEQFYEYGGRPHYFRIAVENASALNGENEAKLRRIINLVKRKSQWIEKIYAQTIVKIPMNVGIATTVSSCSRFSLSDVADWQDDLIVIDAFVGTSSNTNKTETSTQKK